MRRGIYGRVARETIYIVAVEIYKRQLRFTWGELGSLNVSDDESLSITKLTCNVGTARNAAIPQRVGGHRLIQRPAIF